jgi:ADYC domain
MQRANSRERSTLRAWAQRMCICAITPILSSACAEPPMAGVIVVHAIDAYLIDTNGRRIGREEVGRRLRITNVIEVAGLVLRLKAVETIHRNGKAHVVLQLVEQSSVDGKNELNICNPRGDGSTWLIPVAGRWEKSGELSRNTNDATLACASGALGKCFAWGFSPWTDADRFIACTRMARADYCGDGRPHTRPGVRILFDHIASARVETRDRAGYRFEALWARDGAHCVAGTRVAKIFAMDDLMAQCPERAADSAACRGAHAFSGVPVMFANFVTDPAN